MGKTLNETLLEIRNDYIKEKCYGNICDRCPQKSIHFWRLETRPIYCCDKHALEIAENKIQFMDEEQFIEKYNNLKINDMEKTDNYSFVNDNITYYFSSHVFNGKKFYCRNEFNKRCHEIKSDKHDYTNENSYNSYRTKNGYYRISYDGLTVISQSNERQIKDTQLTKYGEFFKYSNKYINWEKFCKSENMLNYIDDCMIYIDWKVLSSNSYIFSRQDIIVKYSEKLDWEILTHNFLSNIENISYSDFMKYKDKWDWKQIGNDLSILSKFN